jgi:hypothetical protein
MIEGVRMCNRDGHYWGSSPEAASLGNSVSNSSGPATLTPESYSTAVQWLAGLLLLVGIMAQSGGFSLHLARGQKNRTSVGTVVTRNGALLLAAALIILAVGLL